uniref:DLA class II histocompatibility antigen, DR-1 beta chain-like n=1 Tax=Gopherus evgoodei TaxID=1825980 RepID=A0A8C4YS25_9SAUR
MGAGWILGAGSRWAGALLVTLMVLRTHLAHCMEPEGRVVHQEKYDCHFTNGTERVRFLQRHIYNRQQIAHFDSDLGVFVADTELGRPSAEGWNKDQAILADRRAAVDTFCRYNYGVAQTGKVVGRTVQPKVKVSPTKSGSQPHSHLLVCSVTGFYPSGIEIKWLKNGQEQTAGVVSTELLQNGDWTFQILVMLEMSPRRGDVYTCQVEHISLQGPLAVHWEAQSDSARSKMLTGVGGFVLGLIFLAPGLLIYLKNKKGERLRVGAGHQGVCGGMWGWGSSGESGPGCRLLPPSRGCSESGRGPPASLLRPGLDQSLPLLGQGQSRGRGENSVQGPGARLGAPTLPSPGRTPGVGQTPTPRSAGSCPCPGLKAFPSPPLGRDPGSGIYSNNG